MAKFVVTQKENEEDHAAKLFLYQNDAMKGVWTCSRRIF